MQIADMRFLIAEDGHFQRRWLAIMLTNLGTKNIIEVADGETVLEIFEGLGVSNRYRYHRSQSA